MLLVSSHIFSELCFFQVFKVITTFFLASVWAVHFSFRFYVLFLSLSFCFLFSLVKRFIHLINVSKEQCLGRVLQEGDSESGHTEFGRGTLGSTHIEGKGRKQDWWEGRIRLVEAGTVKALTNLWRKFWS